MTSHSYRLTDVGTPDVIKLSDVPGGIPTSRSVVITKAYPPKEPETLYHGTPYADKVRAEGFRHHDTGEDQHGPGFYFTNNKNTAQGYTEPRNGEVGTKPGIISATLNVKNPIMLTHPQHLGVNDWPELTRREAHNMVHGLTANLSDDDIADWGDVSYEGRPNVLRNMVDLYTGMTPASLIHDLHRAGGVSTEDALRHYSKVSGYDGVRVHYPETGDVHHIAWFPEQIHIHPSEELGKSLGWSYMVLKSE